MGCSTACVHLGRLPRHPERARFYRARSPRPAHRARSLVRPVTHRLRRRSKSWTSRCASRRQHASRRFRGSAASPSSGPSSASTGDIGRLSESSRRPPSDRVAHATNRRSEAAVRNHASTAVSVAERRPWFVSISSIIGSIRSTASECAWNCNRSKSV